MCPKKEKATDYQWLLSGWQDSNLRPPHPKCGAIPGYATPRKGITFALCGTNIRQLLFACKPKRKNLRPFYMRTEMQAASRALA